MGAVPNEVANVGFERGMSPMAAWREHFGLTQAALAARIGITQAAYAQIERLKQPRKATLEKVAEAMGLAVERVFRLALDTLRARDQERAAWLCAERVRSLAAWRGDVGTRRQ